MKLSPTTLERVLSLYREECQFLKEAELSYPEIRGRFVIPQSFYLEPEIRTGHFNAVDMLICYNQLAFAFFGEAIKHKLILEFPYEELKRMPIERAFIVGMDNVRFKEVIDPQEFEGKVTLLQVTPKKDKRLYFLRTEYNFSGGKAIGNIDLALVL